VYIGPKSRTERPRKTRFRFSSDADNVHLTNVCIIIIIIIIIKISTDVAHVTRDSDTTFKVKRSKVNLQGAGAYCGGLPHSLF